MFTGCGIPLVCRRFKENKRLYTRDNRHCAADRHKNRRFISTLEPIYRHVPEEPRPFHHRRRRRGGRRRV